MSVSYNVCLCQREEQLRQREKQLQREQQQQRQREEEERGREEQERQRVAHLKKEMQENQAALEVFLISYIAGRAICKKSVQD